MDIQRMKEDLRKEYPFRLELHAHTKPASPCGDIPPKQVIDTFHRAGYDGIAITNHFYATLFETYYKAAGKKEALDKYLADYHEAAEEGEKVGMKVYLGAELRWPHLANNDYLLLGINEQMLADVYDYMNADPQTFVRDCKSEKSFFLQAHPFRDGLTRLDPALLDGMEAFNMHPYHNSAIALAEQFAEQHHLIKTMGTDYHHEGHHNLCATRARTLPKDSFEVAELLRTGDFICEMTGTILLP